MFPKGYFPPGYFPGKFLPPPFQVEQFIILVDFILGLARLQEFDLER